MLSDRGLLVDQGDASWSLPRPSSRFPSNAGAHRGRLDTLSPDRKAPTDAAVLGKVFWSGAVAAMGGTRSGRAGGAAELSARELVRRRGRPTMEGEASTRSTHARPRRGLRADSAAAGRRTSGRGSLDRVAGGRASRGPRRRAGVPPRRGGLALRSRQRRDWRRRTTRAPGEALARPGGRTGVEPRSGARASA